MCGNNTHRNTQAHANAYRSVLSREAEARVRRVATPPEPQWAGRLIKRKLQASMRTLSTHIHTRVRTNLLLGALRFDPDDGRDGAIVRIHAGQPRAGERVPDNQTIIVRARHQTARGKGLHLKTTARITQQTNTVLDTTHSSKKENKRVHTSKRTHRKPSDEYARHVMASKWPPIVNSRTISPVPESTI